MNEKQLPNCLWITFPPNQFLLTWLKANIVIITLQILKSTLMFWTLAHATMHTLIHNLLECNYSKYDYMYYMYYLYIYNMCVLPMNNCMASHTLVQCLTILIFARHCAFYCQFVEYIKSVFSYIKKDVRTCIDFWSTRSIHCALTTNMIIFKS